MPGLGQLNGSVSGFRLSKKESSLAKFTAIIGPFVDPFSTQLQQTIVPEVKVQCDRYVKVNFPVCQNLGLDSETYKNSEQSLVVP